MNNKIKLKTRTMMLNSLVRSRMVYGSQTWCLTTIQSNKLRSTYCGYLRKMTKGRYRRKEGSWSYVFTNESLLKMCGTADINDFIQKQQKKYVAHLVRRPNSWIMKQLLFNGNKSRKPGQIIMLLTRIYETNDAQQTTLF